MSKKEIKLELPEHYFSNLKTPIKGLVKSARARAKEIKHHFNKDGWDLDYGMLVTDVFEQAYGHQLENYLLKELRKVLPAFTLVGIDKGLRLRVNKKKGKNNESKKHARKSRK